jgi:hypothetical protein
LFQASGTPDNGGGAVPPGWIGVRFSGAGRAVEMVVSRIAHDPKGDDCGSCTACRLLVNVDL